MRTASPFPHRSPPRGSPVAAAASRNPRPPPCSPPSRCRPRPSAPSSGPPSTRPPAPFARAPPPCSPAKSWRMCARSPSRWATACARASSGHAGRAAIWTPMSAAPRPPMPKSKAPSPKPITAWRAPKPIWTWRRAPSNAWKSWRPRNPFRTRSSMKPRRASNRPRPPTRWPAPSAPSSIPNARRCSRRSAAPPSCATTPGSLRRSPVWSPPSPSNPEPGRPRRSAPHRRAGRRLPAGSIRGRIPLPFVKAGQSVEVALDSLDRRLTARVSEIVPAVDAASRAYIVKIDLPAAAQPALRHVRTRRVSPWARVKCWPFRPRPWWSAANCNRSSWWKTALRARAWSPPASAARPPWKCSPD